MNKNKISVRTVSYINSIPFVYGLQEFEDLHSQMDLQLEIPSLCAKDLINNKADIGLIPVAVMPELAHAEIISDLCIGAVGKVNTVSVYSNCPLEALEKVYLDYQSRTSVMLMRILAEKYWKINPEFVAAYPGFEEELGGKSGGVIIGDRAFALEGKYQYKIDLSEAWMDFTGLPFVFAAWVANKPLDKSFVASFRKAIRFGYDNRETAIGLWQKENGGAIDVKQYINKDISYELDEAKQKGLQLFLSYVKEQNAKEEQVIDS